MKLPAELASATEQETVSIDPKQLARAAEELSQQYRSGSAAKVLDSPIQQAAYLLTRMPATFAACWAVLGEIAQRMPGTNFPTMLDLGSGPGTAAWAATHRFPTLQKITLVERELGVIATGRRLAAEADSAALRSAEWICADFAALDSGQAYDLVVMAYAFGELDPPKRPRLLARAWQQTRLALAIIEPGTPRGYKIVLDAREQLIATAVPNKAYLVAPCPHERGCPMAGTHDWCHFAQRLERSSLHRRLKAGSLGHEDEKFSYVILSREASQPVEARIVRHPIQAKGHVKLELCVKEGLKQTTITRSQGEVFRRARKAKWGDEWRGAAEV